MRRKLQENDAFYQTAISKLLDLCANDIQQQQIVQLTGHLCLTVENGDVFELVINDSEEQEHGVKDDDSQVVDDLEGELHYSGEENGVVVSEEVQDHARLVDSLQVVGDQKEYVGEERSDENLSAGNSCSLGSYHCQLCGKVFQTLDEFRLHEQTLNECVVGCTGNGKVKNENSLGRMHNPVGIDEAPTLKQMIRYKYSCPLCDNIYRTMYGLRRHEKGQHGKAISRGSTVLRTVDTTAVPMMVRTVRCKYVCPLCSNVYQTRYGVRRHELKRHGRILSRGSVVKRTLGGSVDTDQDGALKAIRYKLSCPLCRNVFQTLSELRQHEIGQHGGVISMDSAIIGEVDNSADCNYLCPSCGNGYQTKGGLRRHSRKYHGLVLSSGKAVRRVSEEATTDRNVEHLCESADGTEDNRPANADFKFCCQFCNKVLYNRWSLRQHEIVYHAPLKTHNMDSVTQNVNTMLDDSAATKELSSTTAVSLPSKLGGIRTLRNKVGFYRYQANNRFGWKKFNSSVNSKLGQPSNVDLCDDASGIQAGGGFQSADDCESWKDVSLSRELMRPLNRSFQGHQGPFTCSSCPESEFATYELLIKHRRLLHHRIPCHRCGLVFVGHLEFVSHARLVHPGIPIYKINMNFVCEHCSDIFSSERFLADHIDTAHRGVVHQCNECGKVLGSAHTLSVHVRDIHRRDLHRTCDACGQQFPRLASLVDHLRDSHPALLPDKYRHRYENLKCDQCDISFTRQGTLRRHRQTVHADGTAVQRCVTCGRTFTCQRYLRRHIRTHHGKRDKVAASGGAGCKTEVVDSATEVECFMDNSNNNSR